MEKAVRRKTMHYKRAEMKIPGAKLQDYLKKAFRKKSRPRERMELLDELGTTKRFVNSKTHLAGMLCGQMMLYEHGKHQSIIVLDDDKDEYPVESIDIKPTEEGKRREFLESVLYFGILENHVVVVQSKSLRARQLETHLNWLLGDCTRTMPPNQVVFLSDRPTESARRKIEKSPVKSVVFGTTLETEGVPEAELQKTRPSARKFKFRPVGKGFDILAAAFGGNWRETIKLEDSLDEANLMVNLEVTYFRKTTENAHRVLDNIATSMRHTEEGDVRVKLEGGGQIKGDELKCTGYVNVDTYNGIVDSKQLYQEMFSFLNDRFVQDIIK